MNTVQLFIFSSITLLFFASSSILCKMALFNNSIDAYSFTFFRLFFGVITLLILLYIKEKKLHFSFKNNWKSAFMLFLYALCFSYAYMNLDAGLGALVLFAVVQLSLILDAIKQKEILNSRKIVGMVLAFMGLCYLLLPNEALYISYEHLFLMILSGLAWAGYTIFGCQSNNAIYHTADNFLKAFLLITITYIIIAPNIYVTTHGILLAFISGGITSSLGYALWYYILPHLTISTSGIIQLIVPVIAIFLGILLLDESLTVTLLISTLLILLGIVMCVYKKN